MDLAYENLKNKPKAFRSFTGFDMEEFHILVEAFTTVWERYVQQNCLPRGVSGVSNFLVKRVILDL